MVALIPLFPLLGFAINGLWYASFQAGENKKKASAGITGGIATLAIFASFCVSLTLFLQLKGMEGESRHIEQLLQSWISLPGLNIEWAVRVDSLSTLFTLVITGVGTLIHLYSIGYMSHDETPGRFFAYLNLFCFSMLMLVLGSSLPILFLGWEGVGLCSYLLIGYWYTDLEKAKAGKKAFIANRVGDLGFLLGMFLIFTTFGTLDFTELKEVVMNPHAAAFLNTASVDIVTVICLLLFLGCTGKSAQIPLYVWLPDAMAGPTPVSALIHAATMVTSGIYMIARLNFLFSMSETALHVIAIVGALTAFFAATIAVVQTDIKKVLAYSTVSQLGYMFLACGVGAYTAGVFHVITHAFFKALLFLGAGSVIHGMHEEQDILKMGGLKRYMPKTFAVFAIGWIAICGIPPFAGFFSKDEILWSAFSSAHGSVVLWAIGAATAVMTAFYMTRLFVLTFLGKERFDHHHVHPHESPFIMVAPLAVLALLSVVGGWIGLPHMSWIAHWLEPIIPEHEAAATISHSMEWILMGVSVLGAVLGIAFAFTLYKSLEKPNQLQKSYAGLHKILWNKWYVDEFYESAFIRPIRALCGVFWRGIDVGIIDRVVVGFGRVSMATGQVLRVFQTGSIQVYALVLLLGVVASLGYLIYGIG